MSKFPQGPWKVTHGGKTKGGTPYRLVQLSQTDEGEGYQWAEVCADDSDATARLIAAAPRLYEALKDAQCDCTVKERDSGHKVGCWMPEAIDALAQARGES